MDPLISIIVPVFNTEQYLHRCIESIIHQTLLPDELVLVIDGPISDTLEAVIDKWGYLGPDFFRIIRLKENQGQGNARRIALANARFDYVAVMDNGRLGEFAESIEVMDNGEG